MGDQEFYNSREVRERFGRPGYPISKTTLKKYRDEGVGPLPGDTIKTAIPFRAMSQTHYLYPKLEIDNLLARLRDWGQKKS